MSDNKNLKELINTMEKIHNNIHDIVQEATSIKVEMIGHDSEHLVDDSSNIINEALINTVINTKTAFNTLGKAINIIKDIVLSNDNNDEYLNGWIDVGLCDFVPNMLFKGDIITINPDSIYTDYTGQFGDIMATCTTVKKNYADLMYTDISGIIRIIRLSNGKIYTRLQSN